MNTWPPVVDQYPEEFRAELDRIVEAKIRTCAQQHRSNKEMATLARATENDAEKLIRRLRDLCESGRLGGMGGVFDDQDNAAARQFMKDQWSLDQDELAKAYVGTNLWDLELALHGLRVYMQILNDRHSGKDSRNNSSSRHVIRAVIALCSRAGFDLLSRRDGDPIRQLIRYAFKNINAGLDESHQLKLLEAEWYSFRRACAELGHGFEFYQWRPK